MANFWTYFLIAVFGVTTVLTTTESEVVTSTPIATTVETVTGASLNEITCQEPNSNSSISDHNTAWVCELVNWRNDLAKSKERIDRNCNTSEVEESWKSLFECPDFSNISCSNDSSRDAVTDFFNCSIVFCADGLYSDQSILLGIWRHHFYNFKKIYALSKMIQCRLSDCPEPTDFIPDVDECITEVHDCHENATCNNTAGSYICYCSSGFSGNGSMCADIDECASQEHTCHDNATCNNTVGSYKCKCSSGYVGDGISCEDIDECLMDTHDCHRNAICKNTAGSYVCLCSPGFTGDGVNCEDINECTIGVHACNDNATCKNADGSYVCECLAGFTGNGTICEESAYLDVLFVVDGSRLITLNNFEFVRRFLINQTLAIYQNFGLRANVGVLQYSNKDPDFLGINIEDSNKFVMPWTLAQNVTEEAMIIDKVNNMEYLAESTYTVFALQRAAEVEFLRSRRYPEATRVIVLITGGKADDGPDLPEWWKAHVQTGEIIPFGIGVGNYDSGELRMVANGGHDDTRVFTLDSFENLYLLNMADQIADYVS